MLTSFENRAIYIYQFPCNNIFRSDTVYRFLVEFGNLCEYQVINDLSDDRLQDPTAILLFLVTSIDDFEVLKQQQYSHSTIKIIAYFLSVEQFGIVDAKNFRVPLKARGFQFIYPDLSVDRSRLNLVYPSCAKIFDTVYFKTTRNKFNLESVGEDIEKYTQFDPSVAMAEMTEIGWYLRDMSLNHADSLAGGIAIRFGRGFLTTASKTDKYRITPERICYVDGYRTAANTVRMAGIHPPSSESALFAAIFQERPNIQTIVHFHYKPITFGSQFAKYRTDRYAPYGTELEAQTVVKKLYSTRDFAIACGHGEFAIGANFERVKDTLDRIVTLL
jgi:ribulose-5-phosphate 4-epimerase/fuculose-1-phosphate aldolase